jgi:hypothetical protein
VSVEPINKVEETEHRHSKKEKKHKKRSSKIHHTDIVEGGYDTTVGYAADTEDVRVLKKKKKSKDRVEKKAAKKLEKKLREAALTKKNDDMDKLELKLEQPVEQPRKKKHRRKKSKDEIEDSRRDPATLKLLIPLGRWYDTPSEVETDTDPSEVVVKNFPVTPPPKKSKKSKHTTEQEITPEERKKIAKLEDKFRVLEQQQKPRCRRIVSEVSNSVRHETPILPPHPSTHPSVEKYESNLPIRGVKRQRAEFENRDILPSAVKSIREISKRGISKNMCEKQDILTSAVKSMKTTSFTHITKDMFDHEPMHSITDGSSLRKRRRLSCSTKQVSLPIRNKDIYEYSDGWEEDSGVIRKFVYGSNTIESEMLIAVQTIFS